MVDYEYGFSYGLTFLILTLKFSNHYVTFHLTFLSLLEPIKLLLHYIRSALKDPNHRYIGFQLSELIEGLQLITLNDTNKATVSNSIFFNIYIFGTIPQHAITF